MSFNHCNLIPYYFVFTNAFDLICLIVLTSLPVVLLFLLFDCFVKEHFLKFRDKLKERLLDYFYPIPKYNLYINIKHKK